MKKISSEITVLHKTLIPYLIIAMAGVLIVIFIGLMIRDNGVNILTVGFMLAAGVYAYVESQKRMSGLVDEVWDDGDSLVIKNKDKEERVALSNINKIRYGGFGNSHFVTLRLYDPCDFGSEIKFVPPRKILQLTKNSKIVDLIIRVKELQKLKTE